MKTLLEFFRQEQNGCLCLYCEKSMEKALKKWLKENKLVLRKKKQTHPTQQYKPKKFKKFYEYTNKKR